MFLGGFSKFVFEGIRVSPKLKAMHSCFQPQDEKVQNIVTNYQVRDLKIVVDIFPNPSLCSCAYKNSGLQEIDPIKSCSCIMES